MRSILYGIQKNQIFQYFFDIILEFEDFFNQLDEFKVGLDCDVLQKEVYLGEDCYCDVIV